MGLTKPRAAQIYDIDYKQATRVITVTNITLSGGAPNQVDSVNLSQNDRVLVIGQSTASQNGIYLVQTLGSGSNGTWVRTSDTDVSGELLAGTIVMVTEGTVYHDTQWKLTTDDPIVIGTTSLVFEQNSAFAFGNVYANGTAVLATSVGDVLTLTAGNNIQITGNNTAKSVTIGVTGISLTSIANGTSNVNVIGSGSNITVGVGGTGNVAVFATTGEYVTGVVSATGNVTGGNILTVGLISATGNVTGNNFIGNASQVTGVNTFSQIFVTGATTVNATSLTSNVTFAGGANIALTSNGNTITIAYSAAGSSSIFATGGDMGLIANPVTESEDLGTVIVVADTSYDLGTLFVTDTFNQIDMTGFTSNINTGNLNAIGLVSAVGNITGNYIYGNGSQLTGVSASATFPLANGTSNINATSGGNVTIGVGGTANVAVFTTSGISATGNITGNYFIGNGSVLTGITSTPPALNITLQQNYGGF